MFLKEEVEVPSVSSSQNFSSNGKRKMMRIFVVYEQFRSSMDIPYGKRVSQVKKMVQDKFFIQPNRAQLGDENKEKNRLVLIYAGAELPDHWVLSDMGIIPGSTLRAFIKEELEPVFHFFVNYNKENISVMDRIRLREFSVANLRGLASRRTGLPVSVFRLMSPRDMEMFDCHTLDEYNIRPGDTIRIDTWDGWNDFLNLAGMGFTNHVLNKIATQDDIMARFQMKVALYMAAHFGHVDLALTLTKSGIRPDEPVGEHPLRQWNQLDRHVDLRKCPVHEAVEQGQLSVLRSFVHTNVCCIMARDGNGLQPINIALRQKKKTCASFLLTKQWSRIPYNNMSIPLAIFARMKAWTERSKDKVQMLCIGVGDRVTRRKMLRDNPLVGQGVYVDGFSEQSISSRPKATMKPERNTTTIEDYYKTIFLENPEDFFKQSMKMKQKFSRGGGTTKYRQQGLMGSTPHQKTSIISRAGSDRDRQGSHVGAEGESDGQGSSVSPETHNRSVQLPAIQDKSFGKKAAGRAGGYASQTPGIAEDPNSRPSSGKTGSMSVTGGAAGAGGSKSRLVPLPSNSEFSSHPATAPTAGGGGRPVVAAAVAAGQKKKAMSASVLAKAKATDSSIPLPLNTVDDTPRPFFHVSPGRPNIPRETKELYERQRGINSREFAIKCMAVANTFREKSWLYQVRMATLFAEQGIRKPMKSKAQSMFAGIEEASA